MNGDKHTNHAMEVFQEMEDKLMKTYGQRVPFVMIYVHEKGEMLTNVNVKAARGMVARALHQMDLNEPHEI